MKLFGLEAFVGADDRKTATLILKSKTSAGRKVEAVLNLEVFRTDTMVSIGGAIVDQLVYELADKPIEVPVDARKFKVNDPEVNLEINPGSSASAAFDGLT